MVVHGEASSQNARTISITGTASRSVTGRIIVVASGAQPAVPQVAGLQDTPYVTNETLFELNALPRRLTIVGGGPVGVEMAQAFNRLGSRVVVVEREASILPSHNKELVDKLTQCLVLEGIKLITGAHAIRVSSRNADVELHLNQTPQTVTSDAILIATGRRARVESLSLHRAGIRYSPLGIPINRRCRTNVRHIYAVGDVTGLSNQTHLAAHMARVVASNALLRIPRRIDHHAIPHVVYTQPELAATGKSAIELRRRSIAFATYVFPYNKLDRAIVDGATTGEVRVYACPRRGRILGATVLGARAGELICELTAAIRNRIRLPDLSQTVHPYPTYGQAIQRVSDQWYVRRASPATIRLLQRLFRYRGTIPERDPLQVI